MMLRRALIATALVAGLLAPTAGAAVNRNVSVKFQRFTPHEIIAITGDSVVWKNNEVTPSPSLANHNLFSDDGFSFMSALDKGATYAHPFLTPGTFGYHCTIHPGMHGIVRVSDLYLASPGLTATYGKSVTLAGYAEEGMSVDISLVGGANPIKTVLANATTGQFAASIPALPGLYWASVDATQSSQVRLNVKPKLNVKSRKKNKTYWMTVSTNPDQTGGKVVLERKQGSKWKTVSKHTLGAGSKTVFKVTPKTTMKVRLRLSVPKNGYSKTTSGTITLRS